MFRGRQNAFDEENVATEISALGEATAERKEGFRRENRGHFRHFLFRYNEFGELDLERNAAF